MLMQTIFKYIREYLNMDRAGFSAYINASERAAQMWESGEAVPEISVQTELCSICKNNDVPVYEMTLNRIEETAAAVNAKTDRLVLYHGSKSGIEGNIKPKSRPQCDFGSGFYMGTDPAQALTLICDYDESKFYITSLDAGGLAVASIPADIDWAMLIACNRGRMESIKGTPFYNRYKNMAKDSDVIAGSIANDRMFFVIDNFFMGNITDTAQVHSLSALKLGMQYAAVSQKGCDAVRIECEIPVSHLERMFLKEEAEKNRETGIASANEICRQYRREGLFFDEIIDRAALEADK